MHQIRNQPMLSLILLYSKRQSKLAMTPLKGLNSVSLKRGVFLTEVFIGYFS
jgi:hypothetical protein